jgi:hypothetical protein
MDAATPIVAERVSVLAVVDGTANKTAVTSNAGVHRWHLFMAHPLQTRAARWSSFVSSQASCPQYLYVRPALTTLRLNWLNAVFEFNVEY